MKTSAYRAVLALSVAAISLLGTSPAYALTAKDRVAIINADGTKEAGNSNFSLRLSAGTYDVRFNRNITLCAGVITVGSPTSFGAAAAYATAVQRSGSAGKGYFIQIRDFNGNLVDAEFMLLVGCKS